MYIASNKYLVPVEWRHNPDVRGSLYMTVAMIYAEVGVDIPLEWYHDPKLKNDHGFTLAM